MSSFENLMAFQRETEALAQIAGRLGWDQETVMPRGASEQRAEEMAAIDSVLHARRTDPKVANWLETAEAQTSVEQAQLREIRRAFDRYTKVPPDLSAEIARTTSRAQGIWAAARAEEDVSAFLPTLKTVVDLKRQEGAALAGGGAVYDAMLDDYEPGATAQMLEQMFGALRPRLVDLRDRIFEAAPGPELTGTFVEEDQLALSTRLAEVFGYDFQRGRIDKAVHPFSSGSGDDVRITTRTNATDPFNCFYSTIHEVGHAAYEQGIDPAYAMTPLGRGASMGVHESQSRIYENQLGRSQAFTGWLYGQMTDRFGSLSISGPEAFYAASNRVHRGYIRTEADEVQYNLHVLLRFDLEHRLMTGDLAVEDLEAAWNDRFEADFGFAVDKPSNGVLQDVHWSVGLFGYFPTYTLGNVYAGSLHRALREAVPDLDDRMAQGDLSAATSWLRGAVQQHGALMLPREVIAQATGTAPSEAPLLDYLEEKFSALYGL
ncbi:carboxypeptidase M32 [Aestuariibius insulae]|uniref:carboxypeptidase M32 n=1 Tax=Aestuariibius insulae TaxID=2058287 RepID=UPI00345E459E